MDDYGKPNKGYIIEWHKWYPGSDVITGYPENLGYCIRGFRDINLNLGPKLGNSIRTSLVVAERVIDAENIEIETLNSIYILHGPPVGNKYLDSKAAKEALLKEFLKDPDQLEN